MQRGGRRRNDNTEVSYVIKYLVFGFNICFWLLGATLLGVGLWAWSEKDMFNNLAELSNIHYDPAFILMIMGAVVFVIGFFGCVGALRENKCLLLLYCIFVGIIFFAELVAGILIFVYRDWVQDQIRRELMDLIVNYREDIDRQNLIDWVQADWLQCCGVTDYNDWDDNEYFNCSSPSVERCGVPFSCCIPDKEDAIANFQCGYSVREPGNDIRNIYMDGCLDAGKTWLNQHLIPVAAVGVGLALLQILGICCAQNLRSDIDAQMAKWYNY